MAAAMKRVWLFLSSPSDALLPFLCAHEADTVVLERSDENVRGAEYLTEALGLEREVLWLEESAPTPLHAAVATVVLLAQQLQQREDQPERDANDEEFLFHLIVSAQVDEDRLVALSNAVDSRIAITVFDDSGEATLLSSASPLSPPDGSDRTGGREGNVLFPCAPGNLTTGLEHQTRLIADIAQQGAVVPRGFLCRTTADLLVSYRTLGVQRAVIQPTNLVAPTGILYVSSADELRLYDFAEGPVVLREDIKLTRGQDGVPKLFSATFLGDRLLLNTVVHQLVVGGRLAAVCTPTDLSDEATSTMVRIARAVFGVLRDTDVPQETTLTAASVAATAAVAATGLATAPAPTEAPSATATDSSGQEQQQRNLSPDMVLQQLRAAVRPTSMQFGLVDDTLYLLSVQRGLWSTESFALGCVAQARTSTSSHGAPSDDSHFLLFRRPVFDAMDEWSVWCRLADHGIELKRLHSSSPEVTESDGGDGGKTSGAGVVPLLCAGLFLCLGDSADAVRAQRDAVDACLAQTSMPTSNDLHRGVSTALTQPTAALTTQAWGDVCRRILVFGPRPESQLPSQRFNIPTRALTLVRPGLDVAIIPGANRDLTDFVEFCAEEIGFDIDSQIIYTKGESYTLDADIDEEILSQLKALVVNNPNDKFVLVPYVATDAFYAWASQFSALGVGVFAEDNAWMHRYGNKGVLHRHMANLDVPSVVEEIDPSIPVPRGFQCSTTQHLLDAHERLGGGAVVIKPIFGAAGAGIEFVSDDEELKLYDFPHGEVLLEEHLDLDLADDGLILSPAVHYMAGELLPGDLVDQIMSGTSYAGWRPTVVSMAFSKMVRHITSKVVSAFQPRGPGGFDFLSVKGKTILVDVNTGRFNGAHQPKLFVGRFMAPGARWYCWKFCPPTYFRIAEFWARCVAGGFAFRPEASLNHIKHMRSGSLEGMETGVYPLSYLPGITGTFVSIAATIDECLQLRAHIDDLFAAAAAEHAASTVPPVPESKPQDGELTSKLHNFVEAQDDSSVRFIWLLSGGKRAARHRHGLLHPPATTLMLIRPALDIAVLPDLPSMREFAEFIKEVRSLESWQFVWTSPNWFESRTSTDADGARAIQTVRVALQQSMAMTVQSSASFVVVTRVPSKRIERWAQGISGDVTITEIVPNSTHSFEIPRVFERTGSATEPATAQSAATVATLAIAAAEAVDMVQSDEAWSLAGNAVSSTMLSKKSDRGNDADGMGATPTDAATGLHLPSDIHQETTIKVSCNMLWSYPDASALPGLPGTHRDLAPFPNKAALSRTADGAATDWAGLINPIVTQYDIDTPNSVLCFSVSDLLAASVRFKADSVTLRPIFETRRSGEQTLGNAAEVLRLYDFASGPVVLEETKPYDPDFTGVEVTVRFVFLDGQILGGGPIEMLYIGAHTVSSRSVQHFADRLDRLHACACDIAQACAPEGPVVVDFAAIDGRLVLTDIMGGFLADEHLLQLARAVVDTASAPSTPHPCYMTFHAVPPVRFDIWQFWLQCVEAGISVAPFPAKQERSASGSEETKTSNDSATAQQPSADAAVWPLTYLEGVGAQFLVTGSAVDTVRATRDRLELIFASQREQVLQHDAGSSTAGQPAEDDADESRAAAELEEVEAKDDQLTASQRRRHSKVPSLKDDAVRRIWCFAAEEMLPTWGMCMSVMRADRDVAVIAGNHPGLREYAEFCASTVHADLMSRMYFTSSQFASVSDGSVDEEEREVVSQLKALVVNNPNDKFVLVPYVATDEFYAWASQFSALGVGVFAEDNAWMHRYGNKGVLHRHMANLDVPSVLEEIDPSIPVPRGFQCSTTQHLLDAHERLGGGAVVIKPALPTEDMSGRVVHLSQEQEIRLFEFPRGDVVMQEVLSQDVDGRGTPRSVEITILDGTIVGDGAVFDRAVIGDQQAMGWQLSRAPKRLQKSARSYGFKIAQHLGCGTATSALFGSVQGRAVLMSLSAPRFSVMHFVAMALDRAGLWPAPAERGDALSVDSKVDAASMAGAPRTQDREWYVFRAVPPEALDVHTFWRRCQESGRGLDLSDPGSLGVYPLQYVRGHSCVLLTVAQTLHKALNAVEFARRCLQVDMAVSSQKSQFSLTPAAGATADSRLLLVKNCTIYAPRLLPNRHVLIAGSQIAAFLDTQQCSQMEAMMSAIGGEVIDGHASVMLPGIVDIHVHVLGGGGEFGLASRTEAPTLQSFFDGGLTTVVGVLGFDDRTKTPAALLAKVHELNARGLSAYMYTGSYSVPAPSVMDSIADDILYLDPVVGVGEVCVSDHRGSQPTTQQLVSLVGEAKQAGMLGSKAGVTYFHVGNTDSCLAPLWDVVSSSNLAMGSILPTHVNRTPELLADAEKWIAAGGFADLTAIGASVPRQVAEMRARGVDMSKVLCSSDAGGSLPTFGADGRLIQYSSAPSDSLLKFVQRMYFQEMWSLADILPFVTANPAAVLQLKNKGQIAAGYDADILLCNPRTLELRYVIARGSVVKRPVT